MAEAQLLRTTIEITATGPDGQPHLFTATGKAIQFAGFLRAYVEGRDDPAAELGDQETLLPKLQVGDQVSADGPLALRALDPKSHETTPPARYTDASLVKRLEDDGIGRPSTYASIISTIERRGYVWRQGKALVPSFTAFAVTHLLKSTSACSSSWGSRGASRRSSTTSPTANSARDQFLRLLQRRRHRVARAASPGRERQPASTIPPFSWGPIPRRGRLCRAHRAVRPLRADRGRARRGERLDTR